MSDVEPKTLDPLTKRLHKLTQEWSQGRVSLKEIVGLSPEELYSIADQGYLFFLQGKIQPAQVIFEGLVAVDPRNAYYYRALGAIYWQFTYAIRVAPHDVSSYVNRAEVFVASKQFEEARKDLHQALSRARQEDQPLVKKANAMIQMIANQE
jgi:tetratricopeptide (TPR) repeat protein